MSGNDNPNRKQIKLPVKSPHVDYFQPLLENLQTRDELNEVMKNRVSKACQLLDDGVKLFPNDFRKGSDIDKVAAAGADKSDEDLAASQDVFTLAGRIMSHRSFGKVAFFTLKDHSGQIQCFASREDLGEESYGRFKKVDIGDLVGVAGALFRTKTGELTLRCRELRLITKSMRPLPEKYHGLKDIETRYRQRYVDLIVTPRTAGIFRTRSKIIAELRRFLDERGFLEVETPMMQAIPGGATAKPFETYHNALDMKLYMRIAPELYLKRLLVGGFERVYEIGRQFRNEGVSTQHNPEFTMCEFYMAYARFGDLMDLTEEMFSALAEKATGSPKIVYQEKDIDLTAGTWKRLSFHQSLEEIGGLKRTLYEDYEAAKAHVQAKGEKVLKGEKLGKVQAKLFDIHVEPKLISPHFIYGYPTDISPLSRRNDADPSITDRFELFIAGREIANAFSELNDPVDQRLRFLEQVREKKAGDEEAHFMDEDYVRALEYGMPPAAGEGVGIDRLVMLLTDQASIREVILFPLLRFETNPGS